MTVIARMAPHERRAVDSSEVRTGELGPAVGAFDASRKRLFGIAYRMLGSVAEAEDIVQEAWVRWQQTDRTVIQNPAGFLTTVTTRLAINSAESAHSRREQYIGPWLPEPVDTSADPSLGAERAEAIESAVLLLLETLKPQERAAYILREAFDYPYDQIAGIVATSEANARQLVSRARKHVQSGRRAPVDGERHRALLAAFLEAAQAGDFEALERVLAEDVVSTTDGGGVVPQAARRPVYGREKVARFIAGFASFWWEGTSTTWVTTNGRPSVLITKGGEPAALLNVDVSSDGIEQIRWVMVPDKLQTILPGRAQAD